jgi:hypothetical protein
MTVCWLVVNTLLGVGMQVIFRKTLIQLNWLVT